MFKNYIAQKKDLETIEEALNYLFKPELKFVFSDLSKILNTKIISYDSKYIYKWTLNPIKLDKIPHNLLTYDKWQSGWWATLVPEELGKYLSTNDKVSIISGGLLTPFVMLQKEKKIINNPYITKESYLATIIHELGHIYWNNYKLWWPSDKEENINLLEGAKKLYTNKITNREFKIKYPSPIYVSEVFAHCTEYYASEVFWPKHKNNFDKFAVSQINSMLATEKNKNLDVENSVLESTKDQHNYSMVVGKFLTTEYPKDWPNLLTKL